MATSQTAPNPAPAPKAAPPANPLDAAIKEYQTRKGVVTRFAEQYDIAPEKVMAIVAQTVFRPGKDEPPLSNEEIAAALVVCNAYNLNPFTKEIYAFRSKGKLLIIVGVDGWSAIVNRQPQLDGIEFEEHFGEKGGIEAITCRMYRKDRSRPIEVTEYFHECRRNTDPWRDMPIRMTRNRAFVQCARLAFSISGIVDSDEAQGIEGAPEYIPPAVKAAIDETKSRSDAVKAVARARAMGAIPPEAGTLLEAQGASGGEPKTVDAAPAATSGAAAPSRPATEDKNEPTGPSSDQTKMLW